MARTSPYHYRTSSMEKKFMKSNLSYDTKNEDADTNIWSNGKDIRSLKHRGNRKVHSPTTVTRYKLTKNATIWFKTTTTNENARNRQRVLKMLPHPLRNSLRVGRNTIKTTKPTRYPLPTFRPLENHWKVLVNRYAVHSTHAPPSSSHRHPLPFHSRELPSNYP